MRMDAHVSPENENKRGSLNDLKVSHTPTKQNLFSSLWSWLYVSSINQSINQPINTVYWLVDWLIVLWSNNQTINDLSESLKTLSTCQSSLAEKKHPFTNWGHLLIWLHWTQCFITLSKTLYCTVFIVSSTCGGKWHVYIELFTKLGLKVHLRVTVRSSDCSASSVSSHSRPIAAVAIMSFTVGLALLDAVSFFPTGPH